MAMPDAITALLKLQEAPRAQLSRQVYNVTSFSPSAREIYDRVVKSFPRAKVSFEPDLKRQVILDSWPEDTDDSAARADWGWKPAYDMEKAFSTYLIPAVSRRSSR